MNWRKCERPGGDFSCACACQCCREIPLHRAAPDLLAAVIEAEKFLGDLIFDEEMERDMGTPLRKQLADAIAKAEGRS